MFVQLSPTQERALDAREAEAVRQANQEAKRLVREQIIHVATTDETAQKWANIVEVSGPAAGEKWLQENLSEEELARVRMWELWDEQDRLRGEAARERTESSADIDGDLEQEDAGAAEQRAAALESDAAATGTQADLERTGQGQFRHHARDRQKQLEREEPEAAEAIGRSRPGRGQPAAEQIQDSHRTATKKRARRQSQTPDRTHDYGR